MIELTGENLRQVKSAFKCVPIDPDWPIQSPEHAIELLMEWDEQEHGKARPLEWYIEALTHSHAGEQEDLQKYGYEQVYDKSEYTKLVSISWHLAGRFEYDDELIKKIQSGAFENLNAPITWHRPRLLDFGAAPWIQAIFYYKKGFDVWVSNKNLESDVNRFGRFLANKALGADDGHVEFIEIEPESVLTLPTGCLDVAYTVDVLEHIPPEVDGSPGWVKYADALYRATKPGGVMYLNAPLDKAETVRPVEYHVVHFTSPFDLEDWAQDKDFVEKGYFVRRRAP